MKTFTRYLYFIVFFISFDINSQTVDYQFAVPNWINSCNYGNSRPISNVDTYVNHWIGEGTLQGAINWFNKCPGLNPGERGYKPNTNNTELFGPSSANFIIGKNGEIHQLVPINKLAYHASNPNNNLRSIGVEHEATMDNPEWWIRKEMLFSSAKMACYFSKQLGIIQERSVPGIAGHNDMPGTATDCPGDLPWEKWFDIFNGFCDCKNFDVEPNNTQSQATTIQQFGKFSDAIQCYEGNIDALNGDEDWFQISITGKGSLDITLNRNSAPLFVDLVNANGNIISTGQSQSDGSLQIKDVEFDGRNSCLATYIRVRTNQSINQSYPYSLNVSWDADSNCSSKDSRRAKATLNIYGETELCESDDLRLEVSGGSGNYTWYQYGNAIDSGRVLSEENLDIGINTYLVVDKDNPCESQTIEVEVSDCSPSDNTPNNDDCNDAIQLTSRTSCSKTYGSVDGATGSYGANTCSGSGDRSPDDNDVYYKFTAVKESHTITVSDYASNFDTVIELRKACASGTSNFFPCYDPEGAPSSVSNRWDNLTIGEEYYIRVFEYNYGGSPPSSDGFSICVTHEGDDGGSDSSGFDLTSEILSLDTTKPNSGQTIEIEYRLKNIGDNDLNKDFVVGLYLSKNQTYEYENDYYLKARTITQQIKAGDRLNLVDNIQIPFIENGQYYIIAIADLDKEVSESNESNNEDAFSILVGGGDIDDEQPNLDITSLNMTPNENLSGGDEVNISVRVKNEGEADSEEFDVLLYIDLDGDENYDENEKLDVIAFNALGESRSITKSKYLTLPNIFPSRGYYYLFAIADYKNDIDEINESDNERAVGFSISTMSNFPDFQFFSFSQGIEDIYLGYNFSLSVLIVDNNADRYAQISVPFKLYGSDNEDANPNNDQLLYSGTFSSANGTFMSLDFPTPENLKEGPYYFYLIVDPENIYSESNENNNHSIVFTVDLGYKYEIIPNLFSVPSKVTPGETFSFSGTFLNDTKNPIDKLSWAIYLSEHNTNNINLATKVAEGVYNKYIEGWSRETIQGNISLDDTFASKQLYAFIHFDANNDYVERNENNNSTVPKSIKVLCNFNESQANFNISVYSNTTSQGSLEINAQFESTCNPYYYSIYNQNGLFLKGTFTKEILIENLPIGKYYATIELEDNDSSNLFHVFDFRVIPNEFDVSGYIECTNNRFKASFDLPDDGIEYRIQKLDQFNILRWEYNSERDFDFGFEDSESEFTFCFSASDVDYSNKYCVSYYPREPAPLTVDYNINYGNQPSIRISAQGGIPPYRVNIYNQDLNILDEYYFEEAFSSTFSLREGENHIHVIPEYDCNFKFYTVEYIFDKRSAYPNPTKDILNITLPLMYSEETVIINIFDLNGTLIKSEEFDNQNKNIYPVDVSILPIGLYLFNVTTTTNEVIWKSERFVKK